ncbi:MAG: toll/interleukin-1 receptor domain-containing protein [Desulfobacteraceae bacterium]|nr:toll/interleukin-1 receptor domain-containing protein [Desulfobacteraceae bacterium]
MNKSEKIVIDLSTARDAQILQEESLIQKEGLDKLRELIKTIFERIKFFKKEMKNKHIMQKYHDVIIADGGRGTGKSTFIINVFELIRKRKLCENDLDLKIRPLGIIDPNLVKGMENIFLTIISRIKSVVDNIKDKEDEDINRWEDSLRELARGLSTLDAIGTDALKRDVWNDHQYILQEGLINAAQEGKLENDFHKFVNESLKIVGKDAFVIAFDDIDTAFENGWSVLEVIRLYLTTPQLMIILSGDLELYSNLVRNSQWNNIGDNFLRFDNKTDFNKLINRLEEQYLLKIFKPDYRIKLKELRYYNENYIVEVKTRLGQNEESRSLKYIFDKMCQKIFFLNSIDEIRMYRDFFLSLPVRTIIHILVSFSEVCKEEWEFKLFYDMSVKDQSGESEPDIHNLFNTLETLERAIMSWHSLFLKSPFSINISTTGVSTPYASIFNLLGFISALLEAEDKKEIKPLIEKHSQLRLFYEYGSGVQISEFGSLSSGNKKEPINKEYQKTIWEWIEKAGTLPYIPIHVIGKIRIRFFNALTQLHNRLEDKDLYLGHLLHQFIIIFLNAILVESSLYNEVDIDSINMNILSTDDSIFRDNIRWWKKQDNYQESFFSFFFSCPVWGLFLRPDNKDSVFHHYVEHVSGCLIPKKSKVKFKPLLKVRYIKNLQESTFDNLYDPLNSVLLQRDELQYVEPKPKVFISCAQEDKETARKLYNDIKQMGAIPWLDIYDLRAGYKREDVVFQAIEDSPYFIVLLSSNSVSKRGFHNRELKIAMKLSEERETDYHIIPVRLEQVISNYEILLELESVDLFVSSYEQCLNQIIRVLFPDMEKHVYKPEKTDYLLIDNLNARQQQLTGLLGEINSYLKSGDLQAAIIHLNQVNFEGEIDLVKKLYHKERIEPRDAIMLLKEVHILKEVFKLKEEGNSEKAESVLKGIDQRKKKFSLLNDFQLILELDPELILNELKSRDISVDDETLIRDFTNEYIVQELIMKKFNIQTQMSKTTHKKITNIFIKFLKQHYDGKPE